MWMLRAGIMPSDRNQRATCIVNFISKNTSLILRIFLVPLLYYIYCSMYASYFVCTNFGTDVLS